MDDVVIINPELSIPRSELDFRATRSGGPGGQHVNTSSTRVELIWNVQTSTAINEEQRARLLMKLKTRVTEDGLLRLTSSGSRSQHQNKEEVVERFAGIIARALEKPKPRKKTKPTRASKEKRLQSKKQRSKRKKERGPVDPGEI
jgi:ribosome-associated protein